jgi:polyisoprenoid-binding protein YceI
MNSMVTGTVQIPTPGSYRIDRDRCTIAFTTRHLFGLGAVRGTFRLRDGHIYVADEVGESSVQATIAASSFTTDSPNRDMNIRSSRFLDSENHPTIMFMSNGLSLAEGRWILRGSLTVRGTTRPIEVHVTSVRPDGSELRLRASATIDRYEFGITAMRAMAGRRLTLDVDVTAERS